MNGTGSSNTVAVKLSARLGSIGISGATVEGRPFGLTCSWAPVIDSGTFAKHVGAAVLDDGFDRGFAGRQADTGLGRLRRIAGLTDPPQVSVGGVGGIACRHPDRPWRSIAKRPGGDGLGWHSERRNLGSLACIELFAYRAFGALVNGFRYCLELLGPDVALHCDQPFTVLPLGDRHRRVGDGLARQSPSGRQLQMTWCWTARISVPSIGRRCCRRRP